MNKKTKQQLEEEISTKIVEDLLEFQTQINDDTGMMRVLCNILISTILATKLIDTISSACRTQDNVKRREIIKNIVEDIKNDLETICLDCIDDLKLEFGKIIDIARKDIINKQENTN